MAVEVRDGWDSSDCFADRDGAEGVGYDEGRRGMGIRRIRRWRLDMGLADTV